MIRIYGKLRQLLGVTRYFALNSWRFESDNVVSLWNLIAENDKKIFDFDVMHVEWNSYLFDYAMGSKIYVMKESLDNLPAARRDLKWACLRSLAVTAIGCGFLTFPITWGWTWKAKLCASLSAVCAVYAYDALDYRPTVPLKSLEEYRRTMLPKL